MNLLKLMTTSILLVGTISESYATSSFYVGLEHRYDSIDGNLTTSINTVTLAGDMRYSQQYQSSEILATSYGSWGAYLGYEFYPGFSIEAGYSQSKNEKEYFTNSTIGLLDGVSEAQLKHLRIDLLGKYTFKNYNNLSLIGNLGVISREAESQVQYETEGGCINEVSCNPNVITKDSDSNRSTRPQYGVGLQYNLSKNTSTRFMIKGILNDPADSSYSASLGAQYHF
ncbi:hypothetical protein BTJ40_00765 [Microbulbifer sp. A4B17]|uniref:outer membrane beta-barrel protein n=1 Tax=Microbulbifer sp. A4B17 TaxID=359370 RepID=UPI000D52D97C|nr:outer membrane beta-barrel protein [Microbulbifer sp. A4B17]AWF79476.1 hypothetical protein BTJ40_00765 [Microbulbifer sp. A4B17]